MFSEILKVIPKIDGKDLANMENSLNKRFASIAKKFGKGLIDTLKGGGVIAIASTLIDKVLNPLQKVQETIEKTLNHGSDLVTFAKQFGTTPGNLARLEAVGKAEGLDSEGVRTLLLKFQAAIAQAALNPGQPAAVSNFVGRPDTAEAFFSFIQSMNKLTEQQKQIVELEVFGERQIGRASQFLNTTNLKQVLASLGGPTSENLTQDAKYLDKAKSVIDLADARRGLKDLDENARRVTPNAVRSLIKKSDVEAGAETNNLSDFERLERLQIAGERIMNQLEKSFSKIAPLLAPALESLPGILQRLNDFASTVEKSRSVRGLVPGQGKDK